MTRRGFSLEDLVRWQDFGGDWRIIETQTGQVTLELCACTGEAIERVHSDDPGVLAEAERRPRPDVEV